MSYPNVNGFGIVNNPLLETPFFSNNIIPSPIPLLGMLYLTGQDMLFLNNSIMEYLGA